MPRSACARANASLSGSVSTPPKSVTMALITSAADDVVAAVARAALDVPAEERDVEPQRAELERRAGHDLADAPERVLVVLGQPQLEAGADLALRRRRRWSRGAPRRSRPRPRRLNDAPHCASSAWLDALVPRTVASATPVPSSNHAPTARVSAILSQSGLPHECPRWPTPCQRRAVDAAGDAAELLVALHPAGLHERLAPAVRRPAASAPRRSARSPARRVAAHVQRSSGVSVAAISTSGGVARPTPPARRACRGPANAIASALDDVEPSAPAPPATRASPNRPASASAHENVTASVSPGLRSARGASSSAGVHRGGGSMSTALPSMSVGRCAVRRARHARHRRPRASARRAARAAAAARRAWAGRGTAARGRR